MKIEFANEMQVYLADLIWQAKTMENVRDIINVHGTEAQVVYDMIMAETFDNIMDTDIAESVLEKF